jgi:hypothetical protein
MLRTCFVAVIVTALPACVGTDDTAGSSDDNPVDPVDPPSTPLPGSTTDAPPPTAPARIVAAVDDPSGGRVEIYEPAGPREIAVGIAAHYPSPPPVTGEFVMSHNPIEVFLAVAPTDAPVPEALRAAYPDLPVRDDVATRWSLHAVVTAQRAAFPTFDEPLTRSGSCSNSFIAWFDGVYHDMPGGEGGTCSTQGGGSFHSQGALYFKGGGLPAHYGIVSDPDQDPCAPVATSCDMFEASFRDWNFGAENVHNNHYGAQSARHNMHTGMATCAGTATFHRVWGSQEWQINLSAGNGFQTYVGTFPYATGPAVELYAGLWAAGHPTHYAKSEILNNAATGDSVIWCGNLEDQWSIDDTGCHNWCDDDPSDGSSCNLTTFCLEN